MVAHTKKINIAKEQLEDGIDLFLEKRYISSLTLLGAASEIFSNLYYEKHGVHPLDLEWERANRIRSILGHPHISKSQLKRINNSAKNKIKHHDVGDPDRMYINRFGEAFMMLQIAAGTGEALGVKYKNKSQYKRWFNDNFGT